MHDITYVLLRFWIVTIGFLHRDCFLRKSAVIRTADDVMQMWIVIPYVT